MPIDPIVMQRRVHQIGRIRLGKQVPTGKEGKTRPTAIRTFRLTTPYEWVAEAVAAVYGGTVEPFDNDLTNDHWQVETNRKALDVIVLPGGLPGSTSVSQWLEQWSAAGCTHRCTGAVAYRVDGHDHREGLPCDGTRGTCGADGRDLLFEQRADEVPDRQRVKACVARTRLSVVLPDVVGIGQWRMDTGSWNAGTELGGISDWLVQATAAGYSVPASLELTAVTRRKLVKGKAVTHHFVMPVLIAKISQQAVREIEAGGAYRPELDGITVAIDRRRPLELDPADPTSPPPRAKGERHRNVTTVVPPQGPAPTAEEAADMEAAELARQARRAWVATLPPDAPLADMVALCAQDWAARLDTIPDVLFDRVRRGIDRVAAGELRIERVGGVVRLVNAATGDIALSVDEMTDG